MGVAFQQPVSAPQFGNVLSTVKSGLKNYGCDSGEAFPVYAFFFLQSNVSRLLCKNFSEVFYEQQHTAYESVYTRQSGGSDGDETVSKSDDFSVGLTSVMANCVQFKPLYMVSSWTEPRKMPRRIKLAIVLPSEIDVD